MVLRCIMEDDAQRRALSGIHAADTMADLHAVWAPRPLNRPLVAGKDHCITLAWRNHHGSRLHPGALFCEDQFAAGEVTPGPAKHDGGLQRKHMVTIEVLMQAVVVTLTVGQQQWRGSNLPGSVTPLRKP